MRIKTIQEHKDDIEAEYDYFLEQMEYWQIIKELAQARHTIETLTMEKEHYKEKEKASKPVRGLMKYMVEWCYGELAQETIFTNPLKLCIGISQGKFKPYPFKAIETFFTITPNGNVEVFNKGHRDADRVQWLTSDDIEVLKDISTKIHEYNKQNKRKAY